MPNYSATHRYAWSSIELALATDLDARRFDRYEIANRMSRSPKAIYSRLHRLKNPDGKPPPPSRWTPERVLELKEYCAAGLSGSLIADKLGMTRNAVLGKRHRLGLSSPALTKATNGQLKRKPRKPPAWKPGSRMAVEIVSDLPADKSENPVGVFDLEPHHCRYPVGTESPARWFCGDQVAEGQSYCPRHCRVAYRPSSRLDPQERARAHSWWDQQTMFTPSGQSRLSPAIDDPTVSTSRAG